MNILIDYAKEEDFVRIQEIYDFYVNNTACTFDEVTPSVDQMVNIWKGNVNKYPFVTAKLDNKIIGYAYANIYRNRSAYRFTVEDSIYIDKEYLGLGLGGKLLEAVIEDCIKRGYKQMVAVISDNDNSSSSVKLHQKYGFNKKCVLEKVGFKFNKYIDVTLMQRSL